MNKTPAPVVRDNIVSVYFTNYRNVPPAALATAMEELK